MSSEKSKKESIAVERSIWVDASIKRAWQAVTNAEQLSLWYSPGSPWKIPDLKVGEIAEFHHSPNPHHSATEVTILKATIDLWSNLRINLRYAGAPIQAFRAWTL